MTALVAVFCSLGKNRVTVRTTLINTTFWREDDIDQLHLDSKLLYLYMLTNPDKGLANIYHYKTKVISAYSGLGVDQIEVAVKQLIELGYVDIFKGYYVLLKGHEMAKKGRFTQKTIEKELEMLPNDVLDHFNLLINQSSSGVAPEHKDKDNNKDISITKSNTKEIDELFDKWQEIVGYKLSSRISANRTAASKLLKERQLEDIHRMLAGVAVSQSDQYAPRVSSFIELEKKWDELIAWGRRASSTNKPKVAII